MRNLLTNSVKYVILLIAIGVAVFVCPKLAMSRAWSANRISYCRPKVAFFYGDDMNTKPNHKDLLGLKFNKLEVIEYAGTRGGDRKKASYWLCLCDCGKTATILGSRLTHNHTKSCGCLKIDRLLEYNKSRRKVKNAGQKLYKDYRHNAERRNLLFELSFNQFKVLTKNNCYYCGKEPSQKMWVTRHRGRPYLYNGVDRKDNKIGYCFENCVSCCSHCNWIKHTMTHDEFLVAVERVYLYQKERGVKNG